MLDNALIIGTSYSTRMLQSLHFCVELASERIKKSKKCVLFVSSKCYCVSLLWLLRLRACRFFLFLVTFGLPDFFLSGVQSSSSPTSLNAGLHLSMATSWVVPSANWIQIFFKVLETTLKCPSYDSSIIFTSCQGSLGLPRVLQTKNFRKPWNLTHYFSISRILRTRLRFC